MGSRSISLLAPLLLLTWTLCSNGYIAQPEIRHVRSSDENGATTHDSHVHFWNPFLHSQPTQTLEATPSMCFHCFDTLLQNLRLSHPHLQAAIPDKGHLRSNNHIPAFVADLPPTNGTIQCPLFVTWEKQQRPNNAYSPYELRGCIGNLQPLPLVSGMTKYALLSALQDARFSPIAPHELPLLRVGVSLLVNFEPCQHAYDWTVGVHGIIIHFQHHGISYSATFLPEVAAEQKWDPPTTVESLIRKAGFRQIITPALIRSIQCTRYQSSKCKRTFAEFLEQPENREIVHVASALQQQQDQQQQLISSGRFRRRQQQDPPEYRPMNSAGCNVL